MKDKEMKTRLAVFAENLYGGGVQKILQIILRNFDYSSYEVTLYTNHEEQLRENFYPVNLRHKHIFSTPKGSFLHRLYAKITNKIKLLVYYHASPELFYRLFIKDKSDVGIAFIEGYATRILSGAPQTMKKIAWLHTDIERNHWTDVAFRSREEECACYRRMYKVVCVSKVVEEKAVSMLNINNTAIIYNPIEVKAVRKLSEAPCELKEKKCIRMISVGSFMKVKGYDRLLRVVARLRDEKYDFELLIVGEGGERMNLEKSICDNHLENVVSLLGYRDNPYPYMRAADIYVCSSYAEGFNTAVTEALVLGKAIVSTEVSGVKEQLGEKNEYGIVVPNTEEGLYEGLARMMEEEVMLHYQSVAADRSGMFNVDKQMKDIYSLIDE